MITMASCIWLVKNMAEFSSIDTTLNNGTHTHWPSLIMYFYVNLLHSKLILSPGPKLNVPYKAVMIQNVNVGALALTYYVY